MNGMKLIKASLLSVAVVLVLPGCSHKDKVSKEKVQFMSHMDQAHFFQRQGELKASNQEAESASKLAPKNIEPYLLIVHNLLIAGDAATSEEELKQIESHLGKGQPPHITNVLAMDWAKAALLKKNYPAALTHLDNYKMETKSGAKIKSGFDVLRGQILLAQGNLGAAAQAFQNAEKEDSGSVDAKVGLSKVAYQQGHAKQAKTLSENALKMDKDNSEAWLWKAQMAQKEKDYATAENAYMKALDGIGKYDVMTYQKYQTMSSLIEVLRAEGKIQEAYVYEEILAKSGPGMIKSDYQAATKAYREGDLDEAAKHFEAILKQAPNNQRSALLLGLIRFQQGQVEKAEKILKPLEESGDSPEASKLLAATQIRMGQSKQAEQMLQKLKGAESDPGVLALVGVAAISAGEKDAGQKYIEKSLSLNPDNVSLRIRYGNWLMHQNDFARAASQAKAAIKTKPDLTAARRLEVDAYLRSHNPDKAYAAVAAWRKQQPDSVAAIITSGDLESSQKHFDKARSDYDQAAKMAPQSADVQLALGNLMLSEGHVDKSLPYYEKAVELAPDDRRALTSLLQVSSRDKSQLAHTLKFLHQQAQHDSKAAGPRIVLLEYALRQGDFNQSEQLADEIQKIGQDKAKLEQFMAGVYVKAAVDAIRGKDNTQAGKILDLGRKRFPHNLHLGLSKARLLFIEGKEQDALAQLRTFKKHYPDSEQPYVVEAEYRVEQKQYDQAIDQYNLALDKANQPRIYLELANAQRLADQQEKALKTLKEAARLFPDAPKILLRLGLAYQSEKKLDQAQQAYQNVLKLSPDQPVALNNLAWIYQQNGDKRALNVAKRAYQLQQNSAAIADTYGWIMYKQGQIKTCLPVLEKAHNLAPDEKDISLHLAEAYKADGQSGKAKELLEKF